MARRFIRYQKDNAPKDAVVLRVLQRGGRAVGLVREIDFGNEGTPYYPSEEVAMPDAIRLAENRNDSGGPILVEMAEDVEWNPDWGVLEG
ncbi:MAG: hypothetical protein ABGX47_11050 [Martelella sp.]|uniref:hypothetical protein n=1 Tax=Martelella sp. TaxID=1969699 RepID=UPI00324292F0